MLKDLRVNHADVLTPCLKMKSVVKVNSTSEVQQIISESTNYGCLDKSPTQVLKDAVLSDFENPQKAQLLPNFST